jgi:hypothetical protein
MFDDKIFLDAFFPLLKSINKEHKEATNSDIQCRMCVLYGAAVIFGAY